MKRLIPYRDYNGWLIPANKLCKLPIKGDETKRKTRGGEIIARYVFCQEWNTMMHVYVCEKCQLFANFDAHGLCCTSNGTGEPPQWYNEMQLTKEEKRKWKRRTYKSKSKTRAN